MTTRRQVLPRRVFTPTQRTPPPSHYLLVFEDTNSYQIVARSSIKQINGDSVFVMIRNKLMKAKSVYYGTLEDCNMEYTRLVRVSQEVEDEEKDDSANDDNLSTNNLSMKNMTYSKNDSLNLSSSAVPTSRILTSIQSPQKIPDIEEVTSSDDEQRTFFDCRKRLYRQSLRTTSKKKKIQSKSLTRHCSKDSNDQNMEIDATENIPNNNKTKSKNETNCNILEIINKRVNELNNKLISNSSKNDQQMQRLCAKMDRLASTAVVSNYALEPFIDKSGESFPHELMFNNINLLDVLTTDYGDYARKILRIIYTADELKNCILPPGKPYFIRQPLDQQRFQIFTDSVRYKFKLDSINFGLFYKKLLRRKLTDFLIEERRRESTKEARQLRKQVEARQTDQSQFHEAFD